MEIWKPVKDYEGLYEVSSKGRIRSLPRNGTVSFTKIIKPHLLKSGYLQIELSKNNKMHGFRIHRLVAIAFIPNPENKPQVNHKDGNKQNNSVENLEWMTRRENQLHAYHDIKTQKMDTILQKDLKGNIIKVWYGARKAADTLGIKAPNIHRCLSDPHRSAGGFRWELVDAVHKNTKLNKES